MAILLTTNNLLNDVFNEVEKLDEFEQQQILVRARLKNYLKSNPKPIANYDSSKIKPPTMAQIDKWKHDSRQTK